MELTSDLMLVTPKSRTESWRTRKGETINTVKSGRRKLIMADFALLTYFWDPKKVPNPTVIYVGAAPGIHIPFTADAFPEIKKFILVDPAPFLVEPNEKIEIINDYFTDQMAEKYKGRDDIIFISDIREGFQKEDTKEAIEKMEKEILIPNLEMQAKWYLIIKPYLCSLKFRLPYYEKGKERSFPYLPGYIVKQIWTGYQSVETRLIPTGTQMIPYDLKWYEDALYYHNAVLRNEVQIFLNPLKNRDPLSPINGKELLNDFDSVCEAIILRDYLIKYTGNYRSSDVVALTEVITEVMNRKKKHPTSMENLRKDLKKLAISKRLPTDPRVVNIDVITPGSNYCNKS